MQGRQKELSLPWRNYALTNFAWGKFKDCFRSQSNPFFSCYIFKKSAMSLSPSASGSQCGAAFQQVAGRLWGDWIRPCSGHKQSQRTMLSLSGVSQCREVFCIAHRRHVSGFLSILWSVLISVCWCPVCANGMVLCNLLITSTTRKAPLHPTCPLCVSGSDPTLSLLGNLHPQITLCSTDAHQHNESGGIERLLGGETRRDRKETKGSITTSHLLPLTYRSPTLLGAP